MRRPTSAALRPAGSSLRRRSACWPRCWSSSPRAQRIGEDAFDDWGWRIPFLVSAVLLAISRLDARQARGEPGIRPAARGRRDRQAPLREAFGERNNLKRVLIAFFGIMCAQGAVWYFTFFYMQVFLEHSLGVPARIKDLLLIVMTVVSAPLYVYFGWLSDRVGRKPVMIGGMLLALVLYFPGSHWIARRREPGAGRGAGSDAGLRRDQPRDLLGPVRPGRHR